VLYDTIAGSGASTVSGLFKEVGRKICEADFAPQFTVNLLAKDARLAQHMAADYAAPSLLLANVTYMNSLAIAQGYGQEDSSALFKAYRGMYQAHAPHSQEEG
jgi:3-hydroxyisobutyrate dehydrogenase-like beta-hydroxyacid dehydrogenase